MKPLLTSILLIVIHSIALSQLEKDILFQFSAETVIIRKMGENNPMWYSEENDKILFLKEELASYSDTSYYLIKPKITIFNAKLFETDTKPQINIRIDYYYKKSVNGKIKVKKIENWNKSYYPSIQAVENIQNRTSPGNRIIYTMADKSQWMIEDNKDGSKDIFYISNKGASFLDFALMAPNCKTEIVNGKSL